MLGTLLRSVGHIGKRSRGQIKPASQRAAALPTEPEVVAPQFNPKVQWWSNRQWLDRFDRHVAHDALKGLHPHRILDRRFTLAEFAKAARALSGSTAECGVFQGVSSAVICESLKDAYRDGEWHFGFDSFEGLPQTGPNDARWKQGDLSRSIDSAERILAEFPFVKLVAGWLPATLAMAGDCRFRFVHIDVDIEQTTVECLTFFYPRAVPGAVFVFDDYGFKSCPGARRAVDSFLADKPEPLIELTTGQAVFFKR